MGQSSYLNNDVDSFAVSGEDYDQKELKTQTFQAVKKFLNRPFNQGINHEEDLFQKFLNEHNKEIAHFRVEKEKMWVDFYSGTFYALMDKYKKKYKLLIEDQAEYYFESLFLLFVQTFFCIAVIYNIELNIIFKYELDPTLNLCLYFTSLILHFSTIYTIRNGIIMMKFVVYHSDEF